MVDGRVSGRSLAPKEAGRGEKVAVRYPHMDVR